MSLDTSDVQSAIRKIESDMRRLQADVDQLRRAVDATEAQGTAIATDADAGSDLRLPSVIIIRQPEEITEYLHQFPGMIDLVGDVADALVSEFRGGSSEIELAIYQDPEIDDHYLVFYVRLTACDTSLLQRIKAVMKPFSGRRATSDGWVIATTDHRPIA